MKNENKDIRREIDKWRNIDNILSLKLYWLIFINNSKTSHRPMQVQGKPKLYADVNKKME